MISILEESECQLKILGLYSWVLIHRKITSISGILSQCTCELSDLLSLPSFLKLYCLTSQSSSSQILKKKYLLSHVPSLVPCMCLGNFLKLCNHVDSLEFLTYQIKVVLITDIYINNLLQVERSLL
jgi:hypothetical protein